jgi:uncharacterized membrane protein YhaH (DUF805 family)
MTPLLQQAGPPVRDPALAGLELGTGDMVTILAVLAITALTVLIYVAMFVAALASSVQQLHRAGRIRHPYLVVLVPVVALLLAYQARAGIVGLVLAAGGLGFGYALMFCAGRGRFRWTVFPALPFLLAAAVGSR